MTNFSVSSGYSDPYRTNSQSSPLPSTKAFQTDEMNPPLSFSGNDSAGGNNSIPLPGNSAFNTDLDNYTAVSILDREDNRVTIDKEDGKQDGWGKLDSLKKIAEDTDGKFDSKLVAAARHVVQNSTLMEKLDNGGSITWMTHNDGTFKMFKTPLLIWQPDELDLLASDPDINTY